MRSSHQLATIGKKYFHKAVDRICDMHHGNRRTENSTRLFVELEPRWRWRTRFQWCGNGSIPFRGFIRLG
jgi:hypothetical protein